MWRYRTYIMLDVSIFVLIAGNVDYALAFERYAYREEIISSIYLLMRAFKDPSYSVSIFPRLKLLIRVLVSR